MGRTEGACEMKEVLFFFITVFIVAYIIISYFQE
nr:MAG TPA: hypothetical protein [Caudoviricetes sp.]